MLTAFVVDSVVVRYLRSVAVTIDLGVRFRVRHCCYVVRIPQLQQPVGVTFRDFGDGIPTVPTPFIYCYPLPLQFDRTICCSIPLGITIVIIYLL